MRVHISPDSFISDLFGLGSTFMDHPFIKNILNNCKCGDDCKCGEDGKCYDNDCKCEDCNFSGILQARVRKLDDRYYAVVDVPGLSEENISVEFKDDKFTVIADYKDEESTKIRSGKWITEFRIKDIDASSTVAKLDKGQLFITIFKKPEAQPIKINVEK